MKPMIPPGLLGPIGMSDPRQAMLGMSGPKPQRPGMLGPPDYNQQAMQLASPMIPPQIRGIPGLSGMLSPQLGEDVSHGTGMGESNMPGFGMGFAGNGQMSMGNQNWLDAFNNRTFSLPPQFAGNMGASPWRDFL